MAVKPDKMAGSIGVRAASTARWAVGLAANSLQKTRLQGVDTPPHLRLGPRPASPLFDLQWNTEAGGRVSIAA